MRNTVPVEDLLLLLCPDAVVLVQEVQEGALGLLERGIRTRLEISQVRENTLFKFLGVFNWATESLESERQASDNISTRNVKKVIP